MYVRGHLILHILGTSQNTDLWVSNWPNECC